MTAAAPGPVRARGPLAKREQRLALLMMAPTLLIVLAMVAFPLIANFWISAKPITLADLRPSAASVAERVRGEALAPGESANVRLVVRNTSPNLGVGAVELRDVVPPGVRLVLPADAPCAVEADTLVCTVGDLEPRARIRIDIEAVALEEIADVEALIEASEPTVTFRGENALTTLDFTLENFVRVFDAREFLDVLWTTIVYTVFSTAGALVLGMFAALLLKDAFRGRSLLRGLFLFPYVAPVIAVAYTWVTLLDPNSGALNAILLQIGATEAPVNFLGQRTAFTFSVLGFEIAFPMALTTVIVFESWRYFPLSFLFILARMQSIGADMYEAAEVDGVSPLQQFFRLSLPQLAVILAILFLLRFIWTFNKFDDIFLLTGGAAGTRTLTVNVYEQAIGLSNIGAGAAVAVVVFVVLLAFALVFFRFSPKEDR